MYLIDELRTIKATDRGRSYFVLLLCAFWCNACFLDFGTVIIDKILHVSGSRDIIKPLVFVYLTLRSWQYLQVRISSRNWAFFIVAGIIYLANFVLFPENEENLLKYFPDYFFALILFVLGISIIIDQDKDYLYYALDASGDAIGFAASLVEECRPKRLYSSLDVKIDNLLL